MFRYIKFEKVETEYTTLEFRGDAEGVKVNHFSDNETEKVSVVSIESDDESAIDALVASQAIECVEITKDEFKILVTDSAQLKRIREVVAGEVAKKYSFADEIAINKRASDDAKRVAYDAYIAECLTVGYGLKVEIGY